MAGKAQEKTKKLKAEPSYDEVSAILDSIADGVFTVDKDWRITSFNKAAQAITGVAREIESVWRRLLDCLSA